MMKNGFFDAIGRGAHDWWKDTAYAARSLGRTPSFTAAAVLTLGLGIGAATAIYSVTDTILLQPLPFPESHRLVRLVEHQPTRNMPRMNVHEYEEWSRRTTTLADMAALEFNPQALIKTRAGVVRVTGGNASLNYFEVLGVSATIGRTFGVHDARNLDVAVLSFHAWQKFFGGDPGVVGSTLEARSAGPAATGTARLLTVLGVLPEEMAALGSPIELYTPMVVRPGARPPGAGTVIARLRPGTSLDAAALEAEVVGNAVRAPRPADAPSLTGPRFGVMTLKDDVVDELRPALRVMVTSVAVLLLIACANLANLLLARGTSRQREVAVRVAVGATRGRLVRQILAECGVLALAGGAVGAALGAAGVSLFKQLATVESEGVFRIVFGSSLVPRTAEIGVDLRLFAIALTLAAITSVVFGLWPAVHLSRTNHLLAIGTRGVATTRRDTRVRSGLVVAQLALATVLLVGAALLAKSFVALTSVAKGYDPSHVLAFQLVLPQEYSTARKAEGMESVLARIRALPGVLVAGFAYAGILIGIEDTVGSFVPSGAAPESMNANPDRPRLKTLSPGYLEAVGAQLVSGRWLAESDGAYAPPVALVNQTVVRRYFGDVNPVGQFLDWHGAKGDAVPVQVVGVVEDIRQASLSREPYAEVFMNYLQVIEIQQRWDSPARLVDQLAFGFMSFAMRTQGEPRDLMAMVRQVVTEADPNAGIDAIAPLEQLVSSSVARQRFYAVLLTTFSIVAGVLAAIGIYGVLAFAVVQRTPEIGVRLALGARRGQVLTLILGRGLLLCAIGTTFGLAGAFGATRYLEGMLFGTTPLDASVFAAVAVAFTAVALLACYVPARRAALVDPVVTLRAE